MSEETCGGTEPSTKPDSAYNPIVAMLDAVPHAEDSCGASAMCAEAEAQLARKLDRVVDSTCTMQQRNSSKRSMVLSSYVAPRRALSRTAGRG